MLYLASASPRRAELLRQIGAEFEILPSNAEEDTADFTDIKELVVSLAVKKAREVQKRVREGDTVLGADTLVTVEGKILGKPEGREQALEMLLSLSGKTHRVLTGVCAVQGDKISTHVEVTEVEFVKFNRETAAKYVSSGECDDKAGAYAIQGKGAVLVKGIRGDYFNVVGLPLSATAEMLKEFNINLL